MNRLLSLAGVSLFSISLTTGALALNPQPEPPGVVAHHLSTAAQTTSGTAPASKVMLNPQPLPPRVIPRASTIGSATSGAGSGRAQY